MICFRFLDSKDPAQPLADAVRALAQNESTCDTYGVEPASFRHIPNAPFAYWVSEKIRRLFVELQAFESDGRTAKQGLITADDFRFVRTSWETPVHQQELQDRNWYHFVKGGSYSPFYSDVFLKVNWSSQGHEIKHLGDSNGVKPDSRPQSTGYYFRPALTWPRRTQSGLALRVMPKGCVFSDKGPSLFVKEDQKEYLFHLLSIASSRPYNCLVALQMAFGSYEVGVIQRTVIPENNDERLSGLAEHSWRMKRKPDTANLNSHAFVTPALTPSRGHSTPDSI